MPLRHTRRAVLAQVWVGVGLSGCLGRGSDDPAASVAARLFNDAYDTFRKAKRSLRDARGALGVEDWVGARNLFAQAQSQFERAERDFDNTTIGARRADCGAIREDAMRMNRKCHLYARACRNWKEAATLYERGDDEGAAEFHVEGGRTYERAADVPTAHEKEQKDPVCSYQH
jgi:hypothetical protein